MKKMSILALLCVTVFGLSARGWRAHSYVQNSPAYQAIHRELTEMRMAMMLQALAARMAHVRQSRCAFYASEKPVPKPLEYVRVQS